VVAGVALLFAVPATSGVGTGGRGGDEAAFRPRLAICSYAAACARSGGHTSTCEL
jgi:hypothetical protein